MFMGGGIRILDTQRLRLHSETHCFLTSIPTASKILFTHPLPLLLALNLYQSEVLPRIYMLRCSTMESPHTSLASEKERQVNLVDWHSSDDAANPRNFASWKKTINIACMFFMSFVS